MESVIANMAIEKGHEPSIALCDFFPILKNFSKSNHHRARIAKDNNAVCGRRRKEEKEEEEGDIEERQPRKY